MKKDIKTIIKDYKNPFLISLLIILIAYSFKLFTYSFSIDTEVYIMSKRALLISWVSINRYTLVILKEILNFIPFHLMVTNWFTVILFWISNIMLYMNLSKIYPKIQGKKQAAIFLSIIGTSPIFLEQFNFTLQSAEIAFFLIVFQLAISMFIKYFENNKIWLAILTIILLFICFGAYQSFVPLFIVEVIIICFIKLETKQLNNNKDIFKYIIKSILILLVALIIYYIGAKIALNVYGIEATDYLTNQIGWKVGKREAVTRIIKCGVINYFGFIFKNPQFTILNTIMLIISFWLSAKSLLKKEYFKALVILGIVFSPMILSVVVGNAEPIRARIGLPISFAFLSVLVWQDKKWYQILMWILIMIQLATMLTLEFYDYRRYQKDVNMAEDIYEKIKPYTKDHAVVFVGAQNSDSEPRIMNGEVIGASFFDFYGLSDRAITFMGAIGLDVYGDPNYQEEAKQLVIDLPNYPDESSILITDTHVIIKLS